MGTGTYRGLLGAALIALGLTACGGSSGQPHASSGQPRASSGTASAPFAWVSPQPPPAGWTVATIAGGGTLPYPPSWRATRGDRGTVSAQRSDGAGRIVGYLNLTPQQGGETVANWRTFRVEHNAEEGDRHVKALAAAAGLRFRSGRGACVKDSYVALRGAVYVELACLVPGAVIVGAAPPAAWAAVAPVLERSIASFTAPRR